jgi:hypothetical protein
MKSTCQYCNNWRPQQAELEYSIFYGICTCAKWKFSTTGSADVVVLDRQNRHQTKHMGVQRFENQNDQVPFGATEPSRYCMVTEENFGCVNFVEREKRK